jgi:hypothetical protein
MALVTAMQQSGFIRNDCQSWLQLGQALPPALLGILPRRRGCTSTHHFHIQASKERYKGKPLTAFGRGATALST